MKKRLGFWLLCFGLVDLGGGGGQASRTRPLPLFPPGVMRREVGWDFTPKPWQPMCEPNGDA